MEFGDRAMLEMGVIAYERWHHAVPAYMVEWKTCSNLLMIFGSC